MGFFDKLSKKTADQYFEEGIELSKIGRHSDAISSFDKAIKINPDFTLAYYYRGVVQYFLDQYLAALNSCDNALIRDTNLAGAWKIRGFAYRSLGSNEIAIKSFDKFLSFDNDETDNADVWSSRGVALSDINQYTDAVTSYDKALAINPNKIGTLTYRGDALINLERYTEAVDSYDKALALDPNNTIAKHNREIAIQQLKKKSE